MQTLAFDGRTGAAGDMLLGALLAAGADRSALDVVEAHLPVHYETAQVDRNGISSTRSALDVVEAHLPVHYETAQVDRNGISSTLVRVIHEDAEDAGGHDAGPDEDHSHTHEEGHELGHAHDHSPDDHHGHSHGDDAEGHGHSRTYAEVVELVESMSLPNTVEADVLEAFEILGEAEAAVHGSGLEETAFHEVGTDDAIADVVGCMLLLADLRERGVERVVTTPLFAGGGTVSFSHGTYPVPSPAVVEIAERADWSLRGGPIETELLTPTGAAILAAVAEGVEDLPAMHVTESGYGAGKKEFPDHPNVVRALVGKHEGGLTREGISVLETTLDDATPEVLGSLQETLKDTGARDVSIVPLTMKKSRPGHLVKVICRPEDAERVARRLAEETGTLGVREHGAGHRWVASRSFETAELAVDGEVFEVDVKIASDAEGAVFDYSAEYDDALSVARETGLTVREVVRRAEDAVRE